MRDSRPLTPGETELARSVFGEAIDYAKVRLVKRKWWAFQPRSVAMAPTGHIHFHPHGDLWSGDFSKEPLGRQGLFIHEMTHVWQSQTRGRFYLPLMRHPFCRYRYELVPGRPFGRYGLEQQAEIVRHAFLVRRGAVHVPCPPDGLLPFDRDDERTKPAVSRSAAMVDPKTDLAEQRTDLSEDRTVLANERTFAGWLSTGYAATGIGLAFNALFSRVEAPWIPKLIATAFLLIAITIFIGAEARACAVLRRLHAHEVKSAKIVSLRIISFGSALATLALIAAIWLLRF